MKRGATDHPKTKRLARTLGIGLAQAVGHLELLWHWTARYAPAGDIGRYDDAEIAEGCAWEGDPATFIAALLACPWVDASETHRLVVHDWPEHADDAVHRALARACERFSDGTIPTLTRLSDTERNRAESAFGITKSGGRTPGARRAHVRRTKCALPEPRQSPAPPVSEEESAPAGAPSPAVEPKAPEPDRVAEAWEPLCAAFRAYHGKLPPKLTPARHAQARARIGEHPEAGPEVLARAAHGFWAMHPRVSGDFDPREHFTPDTLLRPAHFAKYVEAFDAAVARGKKPPFGDFVLRPARAAPTRTAPPDGGPLVRDLSPEERQRVIDEGRAALARAAGEAARARLPLRVVPAPALAAEAKP